MTSTYWLALSIGCLECGADHTPENTVIGIFSTESEARAAIDAIRNSDRGYHYRYTDDAADAPARWHEHYRESMYGWDAGENQLRVFPVEQP